MSRLNHSTQSERCLLGCFLLNHELIEKAILRGFAPTLFAWSQHVVIAETMIAMSNASQAVDVITVYEAIAQAGKLDDVSMTIADEHHSEVQTALPYLTSLSQSVPSAANWQQYLTNATEKFKRRDFAQQLQEMVDLAHTEIEFNELVSKADGVVTALNSQARVNMPITGGQATFEAFGDIDDRLNGKHRPMYCKIERLDKKLGGFERGQLATIAARSSHGKSAIALEMMIGFADGYACAMLQMEMSNKDMGYRLIARLSGISMDDLKNPKSLTQEQQDRIGHVISNMDSQRVPIKLHDQPALSIEQITAYAKLCKKSDVGLDVLVIDHLHLTKDTTGKKLRRDQELERVTSGLKELAKNLNIVVILCAQLGKNVEGRPRLKDIRECASVEQDSDVVLLNYYPFKDNENIEMQNVFVLDVAKSRNGTTGRMQLNFDGAIQKVSSWVGHETYFDEPQKKAAYARSNSF